MRTKTVYNKIPTLQVDISKIVSSHTATAHPLFDPPDGVTYNVGTVFGNNSAYTIIKYPKPEPGRLGVVSGIYTGSFLNTSNSLTIGCQEPLENAELVCTIPAQWKRKLSYFHSYGMSENYFILVEQPLVIDVIGLLMAKFMGKSFEEMMTFEPEMRVSRYFMKLLV